MGPYIQVPTAKGKARYLETTYWAKEVPAPASLEAMGDRALICVVDNGLFEAAAYVYDQGEFDEFVTRAEDGRPHTFLSIDRATAEKVAK